MEILYKVYIKDLIYKDLKSKKKIYLSIDSWHKIKRNSVFYNIPREVHKNGRMTINDIDAYLNKILNGDFIDYEIYENNKINYYNYDLNTYF
tara:strand:- start:833 stop:1108 length:276 start_codon:yes stop_codon:yes gene_type:complete